MSMKQSFPLTPEEYQHKRYEVAREILASIITADKMSSMNEQKQREGLVYSSIQLSDVLMTELGYYSKNPAGDDETVIRTLSSILKSGKDTE